MISIVCNIDKVYLGLTVLAIGCSIPDAITSISLSKRGYASMAIVGNYAK